MSPKNNNILLDYCNFLNTIGKKDAYIILREKINNKNDFRLYFLQGCIEMDQGKLDAAIESFKKVLSLNPNHKDAAFNIGFLYYNNGNFVLSEKVFKAYLKTFGDDTEVHRYLYEIYKITNKLEEAYKLYQNYVKVIQKIQFIFLKKEEYLLTLKKIMKLLIIMNRP